MPRLVALGVISFAIIFTTVSVASAQTIKGDCSADRARLKAITDVAKPYSVTCTDGYVTWLNFRNTNLTKVPPGLSNLPRLRTLDLRSNSLTELPREVWSVRTLQWLNMEDNKLTSLPPGIANMTSLGLLDVSHNSIDALPPEIGKLTNLKTLDVSINYLRSIPREIGALNQVTWFDATANRITTLPVEIGSMSALNWLDLGRNNIDAVPRQIGNLTSLSRLDLRSNRLTHLEARIAELSRLYKLYIAYNPVASELPYVSMRSCGTGSPQLAVFTKQTSVSSVTVNGRTFSSKTVNKVGDAYVTTAVANNVGVGPTYTINVAGTQVSASCSSTGAVPAPTPTPQPTPVPTAQPTPVPTAQPTPVPTQTPTLSRDNDPEVTIASSCLAGNGRVDFMIINEGSAAKYNIDFPGLPLRSRTVNQTESWRTPYTGRADGTYNVAITKVGVSDNRSTTTTHRVKVDCDSGSFNGLTTEIQVISYCMRGNGFVRYQFVNPTSSRRSYVVTFEGLPNRSSTARSFGASIAGVSGRPDGIYQTTVEYADQRGTTVYTEDIVINCD